MVQLPPDMSSAAWTNRFKTSSREEFKDVCAGVVKCLQQAQAQEIKAEAAELGLAVFDAVKSYLSWHGCSERCGPLVDLLGEICAVKDFVRSLPEATTRGLMKEMLKRLNDHGWARKFEDIPQLSKKLNLACVLILSNSQKNIACRVLLDIGVREADAISPSLVAKCLKKLHKSMTSPEVVRSVLEELEAFSLCIGKQPQPDVDRNYSGSWLQNPRAVMQTAASELLSAAREAFPDVVQEWLAEQERIAQTEGPPAIVLLLGRSPGSHTNVSNSVPDQCHACS